MHYQREQYFSSFEEFDSFPHGWETDFSTTSAGTYKVALRQSAMPGMLVNTAWFGTPTLQQASSPEGMRTFALPLHLPNPYCWRGLPVDGSTLMTFPSDRELFSMMSADSEVLTISVDQGLVDDCLGGWDLDPDEVFKLPYTTKLPASEYDALLRTVAIMSEFMIKYGDHRQAPALSRGIQEFMIENMLQPLINHRDEPGIGDPAGATRVKNAADYLLDRLHEPVTVGDICDHIGCSRRSLEQSFRKYAGTSPKQFIRIMRLEQCRKALLQAEAGDKVNSIALQHGFWHMGQFSSDYKALFGELPSETLIRKVRNS
jgi:AraC family ethanolamine operon transcriptional activator